MFEDHNNSIYEIFLSNKMLTKEQLDGMMKMHHHDGFIDAKKHRLKKF